MAVNKYSMDGWMNSFTPICPMFFRKSVSPPNTKCQYMLNYFRRSYGGVICFGGVPEITGLIIISAEKCLLPVNFPQSSPGFLDWHFHWRCNYIMESLCQDTLNRMGALFSADQIPDFFPNTASFIAKSYAAFA